MAAAILAHARALSELRAAGLKRCYCCDTAKPLDAFSTDRSRSDGKQPRCKQCFSAWKAARAKPKAPALTQEERTRRISESKRRSREKNAEANRAVGRAWMAANKERFSVYQRGWRLANAERHRAVSKLRRQRDAERIRASNKRYVQANRAKFAAHARRRQVMKIQAMPSWANRQVMDRIYAESVRLHQATGIEHHVDHIVPLRSKIVCGLHCEANLQVLSWTENLCKGNRFWPDMP